MPARDQICLGILAGGQGSRLGFADKCVVEFRGQDLLSRTLLAAGTGFSESLLSYSGSDSRNARPGLAWVPDRRAGHAGPLAGIESLLCAATSPWLLTTPVDLRLLEASVIESLCQGGGAAVVRDGDGVQPLLALWDVAPTLAAVVAALDQGRAAVHALVRQLRMAELDISPRRLGNLNSPADFE